MSKLIHVTSNQHYTCIIIIHLSPQMYTCNTYNWGFGYMELTSSYNYYYYYYYYIFGVCVCACVCVWGRGWWRYSHMFFQLIIGIQVFYIYICIYITKCLFGMKHVGCSINVEWCRGTHNLSLERFCAKFGEV